MRASTVDQELCYLFGWAFYGEYLFQHMTNICLQGYYALILAMISLR
jgi:hypothetical protein